MHWIKTIRENLRLTQNEVAAYLYLSVRTIQSMEQCRRELPFKSMGAAIMLYNTMKAGKTRPARDLPPESDLRTQRKLKALHRRCCHSLVLCREKLQKMQADYENACQSLSAYQLLAEDLATANNPDDLVRVKWTEWRIAEARHRIKENNTTAQGLLSVEIAALESRAQGLAKMLATDITDQNTQPDTVDHRDVPDEDQRPGQAETSVKGGMQTVQPPYFHLHEPLKRAEPEPIEQRKDEAYTTNTKGELKHVDRPAPDPHHRKGRIAVPNTNFMNGISREALDDYNNDDHDTGYNEGVTLPSSYSEPMDDLAKTISRCNLTGNKEPVNSG